MLWINLFSHSAKAGMLWINLFSHSAKAGMLWINLFSHSTKAGMLWKQSTGASVKTYSETRRWSKWEIYNQLMTYFGDVVPFLRSADGIYPATVAPLIAIVDDEDDTARLRLELAVTINIGKHLVCATYKLEGHGLFVFSAYSTLQAVTSAFSVLHCLNLAAVASDIAGGDLAQATILKADTIRKARPAISWFLLKFNIAFRSTVMAFKAAQIFDPVYAQAMAVNLDKVEALRCFPCLDDDATIQDLLTELPLYVAAIDGVELEGKDEILRWWARQHTLPCWKSAVKKLLLVQPSSTAAERVFSILNSCFGDDQVSSLEDYIESAVMLRYNRGK